MLGPGCGSDESPPVGPSDDQADIAKAAAWAGFSGVERLRVVGADEEAGIDAMVRFALRGPAADVDRLLADAGFTAPAEPGVTVFQPALAGVELDALQSPKTGKDQWRNGEGQTVHRQYVRGRTLEGDDLIHVWAFTT